MSEFRKQRKIVTMPGSQNQTAEVVLARTLEKVRAGLIDGVVIAIDWKNGDASSDMSSMKVSDALYALRVAQHDLDRAMFDDDHITRWDEEQL